MIKKEYKQPKIKVRHLLIEGLLQTLSKTDNGAGNGDNAEDYAKRATRIEDDTWEF